jgi:hypothetical protein
MMRPSAPGLVAAIPSRTFGLAGPLIWIRREAE